MLIKFLYISGVKVTRATAIATDFEMEPQGRSTNTYAVDSAININLVSGLLTRFVGPLTFRTVQSQMQESDSLDAKL